MAQQPAPGKAVSARHHSDLSFACWASLSDLSYAGSPNLFSHQGGRACRVLVYAASEQCATGLPRKPVSVSISPSTTPATVDRRRFYLLCFQETAEIAPPDVSLCRLCRHLPIAIYRLCRLRSGQSGD